jgi:hypothetical protein
MAEETVVKEALTDSMKRGGEELTRRLDEAQWPVVASFWYFVREHNRWNLILASPKVLSDGPKDSYAAVNRVLSTVHEYFASLESITVVPPTDDLVRTLASAIQTGSGSAISGIRFSKNTINGHFIDDAYLYRLTPNTAAA